MTEQEKQVVQKLAAQKRNVRPSERLLRSLLAQLPEQASPQASQSFWWLKLAIPAGVALLVGGIFFGAQIVSPSQQNAPAPTPSIATLQVEQAATNRSVAPPEQPLSLTSIEAEEEAMEESLIFDEFFQDELQVQEINAALASF